MTNDEASDARRVWPSGADFATYSAPLIWFAPGLCSTMTGWPRSSERRAPIWRERASVAPPGEVGTTILTGREGNCWPKTDVVASAHDRVKSRAKMVFTALSSSAPQGSLACAAASVAEMRHLPQICSQRLINLLVINRREIMNVKTLLALTTLLLLSACAANIRGTVQLVDSRQQPIANENPKGAVVNMINTKAAVDQASASASVDEKGEFESPKDSIKPGVYKVEVSRIGYETQTETVEVGSFRKKLEIKLRRIDEARRKAIKGATSDEDKIINPGEVNIQAPAM